MLFYVFIFPFISLFVKVLVDGLGLSAALSRALKLLLILGASYACKRNDARISTWFLNNYVTQWLWLELLLCEQLCRRNVSVGLVVGVATT